MAYLIWLGARMLWSTLHPAAAGADEPAAEPVRASRSGLVRKEFLVAITNPKAVLVFTAFVPQFVDPARGPVAVQLAVLGALHIVAELIGGTGYVVVGPVIRAAGPGARVRRGMDRGTGVMLLGMAGPLASSRT